MTTLYLYKYTEIFQPIIIVGDLDWFYSFVNTNSSVMDLVYVLHWYMKIYVGMFLAETLFCHRVRWQLPIFKSCIHLYPTNSVWEGLFPNFTHTVILNILIFANWICKNWHRFKCMLLLLKVISQIFSYLCKCKFLFLWTIPL